MKTFLPAFAFFSLICGTKIQGATLARFSFPSGSLASDATPIVGISVTGVSTDSSFNSFTSLTGWDSAAQISGAGSFFSGPATQAAAGDALTFTIAADPGFTFNLDGFSFRARSTATAPADIGFTVGSNSYDFSSSYSNDSTITVISNLSLGLTGLATAVISIQGWNASSSGQLQLDDLVAIGTVNSPAIVPEPSTMLLGGIGLLALLRRRR